MKLPAKAQEKLQYLQQCADDLTALARANHATIDAAKQRLAEAKRWRDHLPADAPGRDERQESVDDATDALALAESSQAERRERAKRAANLVAELQSWLQARQRNGTAFRSMPPPKVDLKQGESPLQAVDRIRDQIAATRAELQQVKAMRHDDVTLKAQAKESVKLYASQGRQELTNLTDVLELKPPNDIHLIKARTAALSVCAWLFPGEMLAKLEAEIDALPGEGVTPADRRTKIAELTRQLDSLERQEEALICHASAQGQFISRRTDASPTAVLAIGAGKTEDAAAAA